MWFVAAILCSQVTVVATGIAILRLGRVVPALLFAAQMFATGHFYRSVALDFDALKTMRGRVPSGTPEELCRKRVWMAVVVLGAALSVQGGLMLFLRLGGAMDREIYLLLQGSSFVHLALVRTFVEELPPRLSQ